MRRFHYLRDPLCLAACGVYVLDRALGAELSRVVWPGHFRDVFLIPAALPPLLWTQAKLGIRGGADVGAAGGNAASDGLPTPGVPPSWLEIALHWLVWSVAAEGIAPLLLDVTGDWLDVLAYALGAMVAGIAWNGLYTAGGRFPARLFR